MKYQTVTLMPKDIATHLDNVTVGYDRLSYVSPWEEQNRIREQAIADGHSERYWGPLDKVTFFDDDTKSVTVTHNTLQGALLWFNQMIGIDNLPSVPGCISCKIVEIEDDGTVVSVVSESDPITP